MAATLSRGWIKIRGMVKKGIYHWLWFFVLDRLRSMRISVKKHRLCYWFYGFNLTFITIKISYQYIVYGSFLFAFRMKCRIIKKISCTWNDDSNIWRPAAFHLGPISNSIIKMLWKNRWLKKWKFISFQHIFDVWHGNVRIKDSVGVNRTCQQRYCKQNVSVIWLNATMWKNIEIPGRTFALLNQA